RDVGDRDRPRLADQHDRPVLLAEREERVLVVDHREGSLEAAGRAGVRVEMDLPRAPAPVVGQDLDGEALRGAPVGRAHAERSPEGRTGAASRVGGRMRADPGMADEGRRRCWTAGAIEDRRRRYDAGARTRGSDSPSRATPLGETQYVPRRARMRRPRAGTGRAREPGSPPRRLTW